MSATPGPAQHGYYSNYPMYGAPYALMPLHGPPYQYHTPHRSRSPSYFSHQSTSRRSLSPHDYYHHRGSRQEHSSHRSPQYHKTKETLPAGPPSSPVGQQYSFDEWCALSGLSNAEDQQALQALGFQVGENLAKLTDADWSTAKVPILRQRRLIAADRRFRNHVKKESEAV